VAAVIRGVATRASAVRVQAQPTQARLAPWLQCLCVEVGLTALRLQVAVAL